MHRVLSWFSNRLKHPGSWASVCVITVFGIIAVSSAPVGAATVVQHTVTIEISGSSVMETTHLRVRLETPGDLEDWSSYSVYLDDHRELESFEAVVVHDGERRKVKRKAQDEMAFSGRGILYDSARFHVVDFEGLREGSELDLRHRVRVRPYFPSGLIPLLGDDPTERLEVTVRGGGPEFRYRLDGPVDGLTAEAIDGGVRVSGGPVELPDFPMLAASGAVRRPVLRYAWGSDDGWDAVGHWYRGLLDGLPPAGSGVRSTSDSLTQGLDDPRQRLEALVTYVRQKVRYVAVEVGIGGYQPSPSEKVLERKWGDCKDKSLLLADLLRHHGIDAHLALIRLDEDSRIDTEFPSPNQFNHAIVAVPTEGIRVTDDDPVAGGYLFIDPTQTRGSARWLHPGVQDQDALVVTDDASDLVRTPLRSQHEGRQLVIDLEVDAEGNAKGRAGLKLHGDLASAFIRQWENAAAEDIAEGAVGIFERFLPGVGLSEVGWEKLDDDVPTMRIAGTVALDGLVGGRGERLSFNLPALRSAPSPSDFEGLDTAATYPARRAATIWRLALPDGWCPPKLGETRTDTDVGSYRQVISLEDDGRVKIERTSRLDQRWFEVGELEALEKLALVEHRASRRRIRLVCEPE